MFSISLRHFNNMTHFGVWQWRVIITDLKIVINRCIPKTISSKFKRNPIQQISAVSCS